jgi:uncharacterized membrane protein
MKRYRTTFVLMLIAFFGVSTVSDYVEAGKSRSSISRTSRPQRPDPPKIRIAPAQKNKKAARRGGKKADDTWDKKKTDTKKTIAKKDNWNKDAKKGRRGTRPKPRTAAEQKRFEKAKMQGKAFEGTNAKKNAVAHFKKQNEGKLKSTYSEKPAERPKHIPETTMVNGKETKVVYVESMGGYYSPRGIDPITGVLGAMVLYNIMTDHRHRDHYMHTHAGYDIDQYTPVARLTGGQIFIRIILWCIGIVAIILVIIWVVKRRAANSLG